MWWKKNRWKVIAPVMIVAVLAAAFWYGGSAPGMQGWTVGDKRANEPARAAAIPESEDAAAPTPSQAVSPTQEPPAEPTVEPAQEPTPESIEDRPGGEDGGMSVEEKLETAAALAGSFSESAEAGDKDYSEAQGMSLDPTTGKDKYLTDPVPEGKPLPIEPEDAIISDTAHACTISLSCAAILNHMDWLDPEKVELVPEDGWILEPIVVTFYEGESVFHVLQRVCKQQKIHMEFENTPIYNSAYIEGINNLYEFDCGELSGWMYKVNDWFPNYGCSRYALKDGDTIGWEYTCDLGVDVGGYYATGG